MFPDLRPTPELAFLIRRLHTVSGINITASHNPKDYNGYKAYWEDGAQVSSEIADGMTACINAVDLFTGVRKGDYDQAVKAGRITVLGAAEDRAYLDKIESLAIHSGSEIDASIPLVYTPLNGAGSIPFRTMLKDRGFTNWKIVEEQAMPDPDFTTVGYPNPESPAAFKLAEELGQKFGAELLMATDPDSDRFAIEIRDDSGKYIPMNGNQTGVLLVNYILEGIAGAQRIKRMTAMYRRSARAMLPRRCRRCSPMTASSAPGEGCGSLWPEPNRNRACRSARNRSPSWKPIRMTSTTRMPRPARNWSATTSCTRR